MNSVRKHWRAKYANIPGPSIRPIGNLSRVFAGVVNRVFVPPLEPVVPELSMSPRFIRDAEVNVSLSNWNEPFLRDSPVLVCSVREDMDKELLHTFVNYAYKAHDVTTTVQQILSSTRSVVVGVCTLFDIAIDML